MTEMLQVGRYACAHIQNQRLLIPSDEARLLLTQESIVIKGDINCVPYENRWVPVYSLDSLFHSVDATAPFVLILDNKVSFLGLVCDQLSWLEITEQPQPFPEVLRWPGCPIIAVVSENSDNVTNPLWLTCLEALWQGLDKQMERLHESQRLAG